MEKTNERTNKTLFQTEWQPDNNERTSVALQSLIRRHGIMRSALLSCDDWRYNDRMHQDATFSML